MDPMQGFEQVTVSTELTKEQRKRIRDLVSSTPLVALPNGWMPNKITTVEDFIDIFESVKNFLSYTMHAQDNTQDQLDKLQADIAAAGRLFKMLSAEQS